MIEEEERHGCGIVNVDEIAGLLAVGATGAVGIEQSDLAAPARLVEGPGNPSAHLALMVLAGAVDVEELEPRDSIKQSGAHRPQVEETLGAALRDELAADETRPAGHVDCFRHENCPILRMEEGAASPWGPAPSTSRFVRTRSSALRNAAGGG